MKESYREKEKKVFHKYLLNEWTKIPLENVNIIESLVVIFSKKRSGRTGFDDRVQLCFNDTNLEER